ncbi:hypothetical protein V8C37DRAFT_316379 [Trichoderma ceciliae]
MAIAPITGILRRQLILDLGVGLGKYWPPDIREALMQLKAVVRVRVFAYTSLGSGFIMANWYWYGYHMPRTNGRDNYYAKKEAKRAAEQSQSQ